MSTSSLSLWLPVAMLTICIPDVDTELVLLSELDRGIEKLLGQLKFNEALGPYSIPSIFFKNCSKIVAC